jgi:hypothetical protein
MLLRKPFKSPQNIQKMNLLNIFEALKSRSFSFRQLQSELKHHQMPSALGWDLLQSRYSNNSLFEDDELANWNNSLQMIYANHLWYGAKAVVIFTLGQKSCLDLIDEFSKLNLEQSPYKSSYPLPLTECELKEITAKHFASFFSKDDEARLIFCKKRAVKITELITYDTLEPAFVKHLGEVEEIIVVRNKLIQSFDSIVIRPDKNRLEIHIDIPNQLTTEEILESVRILKHTIDKTLRELSSDEELSSPINFFPSIAKLYKEDDGCVLQLKHATGTASIKDEKMRGNKYLDLREELFHEKGIEAVGGDTNCYSITKCWETDTGHYPQVTISGSLSHTVSSNPTIEYVVIDNSGCEKNFEMVITKLLDTAK